MSKDALPQNWRWVTLSDIADSAPNAIVDGPFGSNLKISDYVSEGIPVLQGKNITNDQFHWSDIRFISPSKAQELKRSKVQEGDILIVKIGSIGYSAVIDNLRGYNFAIIPANLAKITPDLKIIDRGFLHKWLTSETVKRYLVNHASKTAQPALSLTKIKNLPLPLPPLPEQRRIAAILDKADFLREKRREAIAKLDVLLQSVFVEMFGDPVMNPKGWEVCQFSTLVREFRYGTSNKSQSQGNPTLRIPNVVAQKIDLDDLKYVPVSSDEFERLKLIDGDLLFVRTNGNPDYVGRCAVFDSQSIQDSGYQPNEFIYASYLIRARLLRSKIEPIFLQQFLNTPQGQRELRSRCRTSAGQYNINTEALGALPVIVPPIPLQRGFIRNALKIRSIESRLLDEKKRMDSLFASLQHRAFTGTLFSEEPHAIPQSPLEATQHV